ncbi:MAG: transglycosylase SLT domain-containing protein [Candidatus Poribacteria bacterium]|nr:transglycosylase SLT domain-containing protein [Candidatus Poribacteria bacterium]
MKNQLNTLLYRKRGWPLIATVLLLIAYLLSQTSTLSNPPNLRPEVGTRGLGLSGAFISSVDDATSPLWNPAGLATLQRGNLIYDLSQGAVSLAYPIKPIGTFGVNFLDLNGNDRFLIEHTANPIGSFELGNNQALVSYARKFGTLQLGASTGYSRAPYHGSLWAQNYDVGVVTDVNSYLTLGIRFRDISGVTIRHQNGQVLQTFDQQLAFGAVLTPHPIIRWHNRFDITTPGFGTSVEVGNQSIMARFGSAFSFTDQTRPQSWSIGFSLNQLGKQFHYTYLNHGDFDRKHLASVGMYFGGEQSISQKPQIEDGIATQPPVTEPTHQTRQPKRTDSEYKSVQISKEYDIDVKLMLSIIHTESNFNPLAVSKNGAAGLMQLMPAAARELGLKVPQYKNKRQPNFDPNIDERFDPHKNLHAGLTYFKVLYKKHLNNLTLALGAYNVGPSKVKIRGPLISRGKRYANKVIKRSQMYRDNATQMKVDLKRLEAVLD